MRLPFIYKAVGTAGCAASPSDCICGADGGADGCSVVIQLHGHLGEDWGSSMMVAGYIPRFNVSVGGGVGAALGMNYSMSARENTEGPSALACPLLQAIARSIAPTTFPQFSC